MRIREVSFTSDGIKLAGHLRVPEHPGPHPAVVLTGPLSGVKEQVTGLYAEKIAAAGYVTLSFDHRNFGASGGTARQHEDATGKLHDLRDAVTFLTAQPEVDAAQIGCCGICLGGGYALRFAAFDPRIRAVAASLGVTTPRPRCGTRWEPAVPGAARPCSTSLRSASRRPARWSTGPPWTP